LGPTTGDDLPRCASVQLIAENLRLRSLLSEASASTSGKSIFCNQLQKADDSGLSSPFPRDDKRFQDFSVVD